MEVPIISDEDEFCIAREFIATVESQTIKYVFAHKLERFAIYRMLFEVGGDRKVTNESFNIMNCT